MFSITCAEYFFLKGGGVSCWPLFYTYVDFNEFNFELSEAKSWMSNSSLVINTICKMIFRSVIEIYAR